MSWPASNLKSLENEILMVLVYYCCYISHFLFNLNASSVCRHLKRLESLITRAIHIAKDRTLSYEELDTILVYATEIQTQESYCEMKVDKIPLIVRSANDAASYACQMIMCYTMTES